MNVKFESDTMVWDGLPCCVTLQLISLWHVIFHQSYATWASWCRKSPATRLIFHQCVKAINYLNVKTLRNWHTASQENHKTLSCGFFSQRTGDTEIASRSWRHLIIEKRTMYFGQLQSRFFQKKKGGGSTLITVWHAICFFSFESCAR